MRKNILSAAIAALLFSGAMGQAAATTINFDSLIAPGQYGPNPGGGFTDSGFIFNTTMDAVDVSPTGGWWSTGVGSGHSGKFAALNNRSGEMLMMQAGGGTFSVQDLWLNGWQGSYTSVTIQGLKNNLVTDTYSLSFSNSWQHAVLNFAQVDTLRINPGSGLFLVDDISVAAASIAAPVPEPEIYAMISAGLGLMGWVSRRRKQQAA